MMEDQPEYPDEGPPLRDFNGIDAYGMETAWRLLCCEGDVGLYTLTTHYGTVFAAVHWGYCPDEERWVIPFLGKKYKLFPDRKPAWDAYQKMLSAYFNGDQ